MSYDELNAPHIALRVSPEARACECQRGNASLLRQRVPLRSCDLEVRAAIQSRKPQSISELCPPASFDHRGFEERHGQVPSEEGGTAKI